MDVPTPLEHHRYVGDKRTLVVYDLQRLDDEQVAAAVGSLVAAESYLVFGPDTLAEARNRGYRPHASTREAADTPAGA